MKKLKRISLNKILALIFLVSTITLANAQSVYLSWANSIGGSSYDNGNAIVTDNSGNVYVTGFFSGTVDFDPGPAIQNLTSSGGWDIFLAKYSSTGDYIYAKQIAGPANDVSNAIAVDKLRNVYITGLFQNTADFDPGPGVQNLTSAGGLDAFLAKYDGLGNLVYAKNMGGPGTDEGTAVVIDQQENAYITGEFQSIADFDPGAGAYNLTSAGGVDIFFAKYDPSGNYIYAKSMGGPSDDSGYDIAIDGLTNAYITGSFESSVDFDPGVGVQTRSSAGGKDIFFGKYDVSGNYLFAQTMGGASNESSQSIGVHSSGNIFIAGYFYGTTDFDPGAGTQNLTPTSPVGDTYIAKYDLSGNYIFAKGIFGNTEDDVYNLEVDSFQNVFIAGYYKGTIDVDPGPGVENLNAVGNNDIYFAKYDGNGNYLYSASLGGSSREESRGMAINSSGTSVYLTGYLEGTGDFDPTAGIYDLTCAGVEDFFIAKYTEASAASIENASLNFEVQIYPNPVSSFANIYVSQIDENISKFQLMNMAGQVLFSGKLTEQNTPLNLSGISAGIYIITIDHQQGSVSRKIIVNR
jgi:hypothetical protein